MRLSRSLELQGGCHDHVLAERLAERQADGIEALLGTVIDRRVVVAHAQGWKGDGDAAHAGLRRRAKPAVLDQGVEQRAGGQACRIPPGRRRIVRHRHEGAAESLCADAYRFIDLRERRARGQQGHGGHQTQDDEARHVLHSRSSLPAVARKRSAHSSLKFSSFLTRPSWRWTKATFPRASTSLGSLAASCSSNGETPLGQGRGFAEIAGVPLVTGGIITAGPSATATFTAGFTPGTFTVTAMSVDDPTVVQSVPITIVAASNLTHLNGTLTLVGSWDDATPTFREVVNVSMSATVTVNMGVRNGRQFIPDVPAAANGPITGDAIQVRGCGTEHDTFTGGTIVQALPSEHGPFETTDVRLQFFANGTDNLSLPESCGVSFVNPRSNLQSLYNVSLRVSGTVLRSSDGTTILSVDFNRTVAIDPIESGVGGGTVTITGRLQPVP